MPLSHGRPTVGPSCTEFFYPGCWHFDNGAISKFDDVLLEHGGLPHVLPLAVHLDCVEQIEGVIQSNFYSLSF